MSQKGRTRKTPSSGLGERQRGMPVWICAANGHTCGWVSAEKKQVRNKDEDSLALVEGCVMKYAAGGCFDHECCDLCDYDCTTATCHRISHTKTRKRKASPERGVRPLHTAPALGIVSPEWD